jgi:ribosomal protein S5
MTRKGKVPSMSALVVVGNGNGAAGYGEGKSEDVESAIRKATNRAIKSMTYIDRYDGRTVHHDIEHKFKSTYIELRPRPPGFGNRSNPYIHEVCYCIGISDLSGKVRGSRNPINVVKGTFEALLRQKSADDIARSRGRKLIDVYQQYYGVKQV